MQVGNIDTPSTYFHSLESRRLQALPKTFTVEGDHKTNPQVSTDARSPPSLSLIRSNLC